MPTEQAARRGPWLLAAAQWRIEEERRLAPEQGLLRLSADELGLVLKFLPDVEDIAKCATLCRTLKLAASRAADARAASAPVPLPLQPGESKLRAVRWAEAMGGLAPRTLAAGDSYDLVITGDGELLYWGSPACRPRQGPQRSPVRWNVEDGEPPLRAHAVSTSFGHTVSGRPTAHSFVVDRDGSLWCWGENWSGQFGLGYSGGGHADPCRTHEFKGTRALQVSTGGDKTLVLTAHGLVYTAGTVYEYGEGQVGETRIQHMPGFAGRRLVEVSAGLLHSAAVDEAGVVWTWGKGENGRLGHGTLGCAFNEKNEWAPKKVEALAAHRVRHVSVGRHHTLAVTATGELYAWGQGRHGELGLATRDDQDFPQHVTTLAGTTVRQASAGGQISAVLSEAGEVHTMGNGSYGQLGHGDVLRVDVPTLVKALARPPPNVNALTPAELKVELSRRGLSAAGAKAALAARLVVHLEAQPAHSPVVEVAVCNYHMLARTEDGTIFTWGTGNLGRGRFNDKLRVPKQIVTGVFAPQAGV